MNYLKFTQYAYLLASILFAIDAFTNYKAGDTNKAILSGVFTLAGIFMFFFRRKFSRKFQERNTKK